MKKTDKIILIMSSLFVLLLGIGALSVMDVFNAKMQDSNDISLARQQKEDYAESLKDINFEEYMSKTNNNETLEEPDVQEATETMNVLLLGLDGESANEDIQHQQARADTIMLVSINPVTKTTKVLSLPRDTYIYNTYLQEYGKLNATYVYGGPQGTVQAVEELLQVPIDFYVTVNMTGLASLIDAIGGIKVTPPLTFTYRGTEFHEGQVRSVNGVKAMNYVRMRKEDPRGDYGRQDRQQEVVKAIINKAITMNYTDYVKLIPFAVQHVRTNVEIFTAYELYSGYRDSVKDIERVSIEDGVDSMMYEEQYYAYITPEVQLRVANIFRLHSGLSELYTINSPEIPVETDLMSGYEPNQYEVEESPVYLESSESESSELVEEVPESGSEMDWESGDEVITPPESADVPVSEPEVIPLPIPEPTPEPETVVESETVLDSAA